MIRWALAEMRRPLMSIPRRRRSSISPVSTRGSTTTPLPIAHTLPGYRIPDGIRWNLKVSLPRTIVWPALLPPWKRMTRSACSARRSVTFPLPSSPHWAPTTTFPGISLRVYGRVGLRALRAARRHAQIGAHDRDGVVADLDQPGDRARPELTAEPHQRVRLAERVQLRQLGHRSLERLRGVAEVLRPRSALADPLDLGHLGAQVVQDRSAPGIGSVGG